MIIKRIIVENYLCYYDSNSFELANGLNIVLGENGEGKTKFFEALDWLLNGDERNLDALVSAKKLNEVEIGESFITRILMEVTHAGEKKIISKSFKATKTDDRACSVSNYHVEGIVENNAGEREQVDGKRLLDQIFPFEIRRYSMFKGEAELNIFENPDALINLINLFSQAKVYGKYSQKGLFLREKAESALESAVKTNTNNRRKYDTIVEDISLLQKRKGSFEERRDIAKVEIKSLEKKIKDADSHVDNAELLNTLNRRIYKIEEQISDTKITIRDDYTTSLFDEKWILSHFEKYHSEYQTKINEYSRKRRKLQSEFDKEKGIKEGENNLKARLLNEAIPLPIGVPSRPHMEEMIDEEICKVCNREAKKGSEAYEFMKNKLQSFIDSISQGPEKIEEEVELFKYDYITRLTHLGTNHEENLRDLKNIKSSIEDRFKFNQDRMLDIQNLEEQLEKEKVERDKLIGQSSIGEKSLEDLFKNYRSWNNDLTDRREDYQKWDEKVREIEKELREKKYEKSKFDNTDGNKFLRDTLDILSDIETIFNDTKDHKFDVFINDLELKSNAIFKRINIDAFTGTIVFAKRRTRDKTIIDIELHEGDRKFHKPNQSLETSMHISILFAISELAQNRDDEMYPMIFDAPTSSFGENKTSQFLNLINETENQKILLIKDFLKTDSSTKQLKVKPEFDKVQRSKAFWVKLERPFDPNDLTTINSNVITL
jgi:DNA sulfur modification protein DndD